LKKGYEEDALASALLEDFAGDFARASLLCWICEQGVLRGDSYARNDALLSTRPITRTTYVLTISRLHDFTTSQLASLRTADHDAMHHRLEHHELANHALANSQIAKLTSNLSTKLVPHRNEFPRKETSDVLKLLGFHLALPLLYLALRCLSCTTTSYIQFELPTYSANSWTCNACLPT
jgi:hypothetical protein